MPPDNLVTKRYTSGEYAQANPDWDSSDSPWKSEQVVALLNDHQISPATIVEIGCGAGGVLRALRERFPECSMQGFDIAPNLIELWKHHSGAGIEFNLGDYFSLSRETPELTLILDVLEHLADPHEFLAQLKKRSRYVVFHFPLDLSAISVLRETPLLHVRRKVGHIHYFSRGLALELLQECDFEVIDSRYTGASFSTPGRSLATRCAGLVRRLVRTVLGDIGVRLLGGETLIVLARPRDKQ